MNVKTFIQKALSKDSPPAYVKATSLLACPNLARILHGITGISSEGGELLSMLKAHLMYGRPLDKINIVEECGDILWFMTILLGSIDSNIEEAMQVNCEKLSVRYPQGFSESCANNRNVEKERTIIERNMGHIDDK